MNPKAEQLRARIRSLVTEYYEAAFPETRFVPGESSIPYAGRVFDDQEIRSLVDASTSGSPPAASRASSSGNSPAGWECGIACW